MFLYELGRWEEARDLYEQLAPEADWGVPPSSQAVNALASLAGAAARLGDDEQAQRISLKLAEKLEEAQGAGLAMRAGMLPFGRARIAAVLGEREEAVQLLRESYRLAQHKGLAASLAYHSRDFESLRDYLPYQQFIKPRG